MLLTTQQGKASTKRALLIGVGDYPSEEGWHDLGSKNDVEWLSQILPQQGFAPQNIHTLTDKKATKKGILNALQTYLIQQVEPNDIVLFHFSGHGQQVTDDDGDEADGYDEALVPYDSPKKYEDGKYEGAQLIRDEELGALLNEIRLKIGKGGHLLVLLDACHSGTGTRLLKTSRGTNIKMASATYEKAQLHKQIDEELLPEVNSASEQLAPMVAFFSSAPKEQSFEVRKNSKQYGLLTYSFCKTLSNINSSMPYADLLSNMQLEAAKNGLQQRPQAEGNLNLSLFNNATSIGQDYYQVLQQFDRQTLQINVGLLHNLSEKSSIAFYDKSIADFETASPLAKGTITRVGLIESTVRLDNPLSSEDDILASKVIFVEKHFEHLSLNIQLDLSNESFRQKLVEEIAHYETLKITNHQPDLFLKEENNRLKIIKFNDLLLFDEPINTVQIKVLTTQIIRYAQVNFLRQLELNDKNYQVKLALINPRKGKVCTQFKVGSTIQLRLTNIGQKAAYYQVLDIMPNDDFGVAIPLEEESPSDYWLEPNQSKTISTTFTVNPPIGQELFKVIASPQPINLREILINKGQQKASNSAIGVLMQASFNGNMRKGRGIKARNIGVSSVLCEVIND